METDQLTDAQIAALTPEQVEEFESNPESLEKYLADQGKATEETSEEPEQEEESEDSDESDEGAANGAGETEDQGEEEPAGVSTKNGKGIIPYEKHKELRVENAALRKQLEDLQRAKTDLDALTKQQRKSDNPALREELQKAKQDLAAQVDAVKEDFPDIANPFSTVTKIIDSLADRLDQVTLSAKEKAEADAAEKKRQEEAQQREINERVQEAKENTPDLMLWEAEDEDAWAEALRQDQALLMNPKWVKKSYEERFAEVVKRVRAIMPEAKKLKTEATQEQTKEKAKAKLEKAPERKLTTLSDIKGGANPASEVEQMLNMDPHELARKLMTMPEHKQRAMRADLD